MIVFLLAADQADVNTVRHSDDEDDDDDDEDVRGKEQEPVGEEAEPNADGDADAELQVATAPVTIAAPVSRLDGEEELGFPDACLPLSWYKKMPILKGNDSQFWVGWALLRLKTFRLIENKYFETAVIIMILLSSLALVRTISPKSTILSFSILPLFYYSAITITVKLESFELVVFKWGLHFARFRSFLALS